ncbi:LuxR family transcriptional regulator [Mycobacterium sp. UM_CSW]|uniref:helix-turn-helix transcriptional regulator n=1 Tax=Mycobacterium sp. UM_CSW TaxID=1370119 RepID=UPI00082994D9|nr:LuxR family transcriptional regulator [Mycobacterium sp. UM_CSW]
MAELKVGDSLLRSLVQGGGAVLVVEGPPGIGKTRLATELTVRAADAGVRILRGQAFEYQQTMPFFSLLTATMHADPPVGDAQALQRLSGSADLRFWVVQELNAGIRAAAAETPLMILLEDIHWADNATILALRTLTQTLHDAPVLWVFTARIGAGGPTVQSLLTDLKERRQSFLRLRALPRDGVIDMVEDAVRARAEVSLLNMADKAHGNPFLVIEVLGGLVEENRIEVRRGCAVVTGDTLPHRVTVSMRHRLNALSHPTREVVQVAAVLPDRFCAALLARVLERQPAALVSAIEETVRADLLVAEGDKLGFRHELLREAARQSLPQSLRRAIERQTASAMLQMGASPEAVAAQLARSADVGDQAAITALRQAAQSMASSDQSAAADLSKRALELLPADDSQRGALLTETVGLLNRAARFGEAEELAVGMLSQLSPEEEAQARLRLPAAADSLEERVAEHRRALRIANISEVTRARHSAWLACNHAVSGTCLDESVIADAVTAAEATGDREALNICEISRAVIDCVNGYAREALQRIDRLDPTAHHDAATSAFALPEIHRTNLLIVMGRTDEAAAVVADGHAAARRERNELATTLWTMMRATLDLTAGRLSTARKTLESVPEQRWGVQSEMSLGRWLILAEVAARTGDRNLLQAAMGAARAANPGGTTLVNRGAAYILALGAWQCGDLYQAVRWLSPDTGQVFNPLWPNHFEQLVLATRVAAAASDAGMRARVLRSVELLERESAEVALFAAMKRYVCGIFERNALALTEAAVALRASRPLLSASAAEDAGAELSHAGNNAGAIDQFTIAFDTYLESHATEDARRVGRRLRQLGVRRRISIPNNQKAGWDCLTDAELRVANLIATGATNAVVAEQLHLSTHTVKSHVSNAFSKLGINSRLQLAEMISDRAQATSGCASPATIPPHRVA